MTLKLGYVYGDHWAVDNSQPLSDNSFCVYGGVEETGDETYYLEGRPVILKTIKYGPGLKRDDVIRRRQAFARQVQVLALEHFMLPEPLHFVAIPNDHTPEIAGTDLADNEPLLVYAYTPGRTLREWVQGDALRQRLPQPLPILEAIAIIERIADFLAYLHQEGYSHVAISPDHFLYHNGSLRTLGLGKIAPIDRATGYAQPYEPLALPAQERPYTMPGALAAGRFGLGNEWWGLAFLLIYLVSGECPSQSVRKPGDTWPVERLEKLVACFEVKALLRKWLTAADCPFSKGMEQNYRDDLSAATDAQRQALETESIQACEIGIFVDFANMWEAFSRQAAGKQDPPVLDFDAISAHYACSGQVYKCVAVPESYAKRGADQALLGLERAGWAVRRVQAPKKATEDGTSRLGMDEKDDSVLVHVANRFLSLAHPRQIVIVSNDKDYEQLVERARFQNVAVTVICGHDPAAAHQTMSFQYLHQLQAWGIQVRSIYTFPFVFAEETRDYFANHGLLSLPETQSTQHRTLLWALVREAGRDGVHQLFKRANAQSDGFAYKLMRSAEHYPSDFHTACARILLNSTNLVAEVESLRKHRAILERFSPRSPDLLTAVYAVAGRDPKLAKHLANAAAQVEENWNILAGRLDNEVLVRFLVGKSSIAPDLRQVLAEDPARYVRLVKRFDKKEKQITWILSKFGAEALPILEQHGERCLAIFQRFGAAAFEQLRGDRTFAALDILEDRTAHSMIEEWHRRHNNLDLVALMISQPQLRDLVQRAGIGVAEVYQAERDMECVRQVVRISTVTICPVEEGYQTWLALCRQGLPIEKVLTSLDDACAHTSRLFRKRLPPEEFAQLVVMIYRADQESALPALLDIYAQLGRSVLVAYQEQGAAVLPLARRHHSLLVTQSPDVQARTLACLTHASTLGVEADLDDLVAQMGVAALDSFEHYGPALFPVVAATELAVVNLLVIYRQPDVFASLQRYGHPAYDLVRAWRDIACDALVRLRRTDLSAVLGNAQTIPLLEAWYAAHGDLQALDLLAAEPNLLLWSGGFGRLMAHSEDAHLIAQQGLALLDLYSGDRDLPRLHAAMRLATGVGLPIGEAHWLLCGTPVPTEVAGQVITNYAPRIAALPTADERLRLVRALCHARTDGSEAHLLNAYDQVGVTALAAYEQFGARVLALLHDIPADSLELMIRHPQLFSSFLSYTTEAYRLVREFGPAAVRHLIELEQHDLSHVLCDRAWPVLVAWYQSYHDLDIMPDLVLNFELMSYIERLGLSVVPVWRALQAQQGAYAERLLARHAELLLNPAYDYQHLVPVLGKVEPGLLERVVLRHYSELLCYPGISERIRFCNLFVNRLDLDRDGERYVKLCTTINRMALLPLVEASGARLLDLLYTLKCSARVEAVRFVQRLPSRTAPAYVNSILQYSQHFVSWPDTAQVKLVEACQHQPVAEIVDTWNGYGEAGLDEIVKHGKLGWTFKLTHPRQK